MKQPNQKNLGFSLVYRVVFPVGLTVVLFLTAFYLIAIPSLKDHLIASRREMASELVGTVHTLLENYNQRVIDGELTLEEAQERARERIRSLRYGPQDKDYFWINDMTPIMIMHPYRTDLEGKDISDFVDPKQNHLFVAMVDTVKKDDSGFVDYMWQWKDDSTRIVNKQSFVRLFKPWNWIVGTGLYIEDVNEKIRLIIRNLIITFSVILVVIVLLSLYIIWNGSRLLQERIKSEQRYRLLFENSHDAVYIRTYDGVFLDWNKAFEDLFGYSSDEFKTISLSDIYVHLEDLDALINTVNKAGFVQNREIQFKHKEGHIITTLVTSSLQRDEQKGVSYIQGIIRDITELKELEMHLAQAQKMEAVGRLAGGIAHDFNNILTSIYGNAELAQFHASENLQASSAIQDILIASERGSDLTRQLLTFSRKQMVKKSILDINTILKRAESMIKPIIRSNITVEMNTSDSLWLVKGDPSQIEQVILNLVINARDAMEEGGTISIETSNIYYDQPVKDGRETISPGHFVLLSVNDTGSGIPPEYLDKIFEPFFTTKQEGKGTGLGLATIYGVVKHLGGYIVVQSVLDVGTTFRVYFPSTDQMAPATTQVEQKAVSTELGGQEFILIVEDDNAVRTVLINTLHRYGYRVHGIDNAEEAITWLSNQSALPDLVVLDMVMPGMNGITFHDKIRDHYPSLRFLFISGYTEKQILDDILTRNMPFLPKPFGPKVFLQKVRSILNR